MQSTKRKQELLEMLRDRLGCLYLSDLRTGKMPRLAGEILRQIRPEDYTLAELSDAAFYLYGKKEAFSAYKEAKLFFRRV